MKVDRRPDAFAEIGKEPLLEFDVTVREINGRSGIEPINPPVREAGLQAPSRLVRPGFAVAQPS